MTRKLLKTSFAFFNNKMNKSDLTFPSGVQVQAANLSIFYCCLDVHWSLSSVSFLKSQVLILQSLFSTLNCILTCLKGAV